MARLVWLLILLSAGCAQVPEKPCPVCPPPPTKPAPERAQYVETSFAALPGWDNTQLEPSLRAFLAGCPRAPAPLLGACGTATTLAAGDEAGARRFFENTFVPYPLGSTETSATPIITRYSPPIPPRTPLPHPPH